MAAVSLRSFHGSDTSTAEILSVLYRELTTQLRVALAEGEPVIPTLLGVRQLPPGGPMEYEVLHYPLLDARQHLYAMRASWQRDALAGLVFACIGEGRFADEVVPGLMTVVATPEGVVAEMRALTDLNTVIPAPPEALAAYEDVFRLDIPLLPIRPQRRHG